MSSSAGTMQEFQRPTTDREIDPNTQRQVIELAARLQEQARDHVSQHELEDLAVEAGLSREYVREAMRQLEPQPKVKAPAKTKAAPAKADSTWFYVISIAMIVTYVAISSSSGRYGPNAGLFLAGLALITVLGFFAPRRWTAAIYGVIIGGLAISINSIRTEPYEFFGSIGIGLLIGVFSAWLRERLWPLPQAVVPEPQPETSDDRLDRLERLRTLRSELEAERIRRAFLSVDVVGSVGVKQSLGELEAERLFGLYQRWVAETVANHGGEIQSAAGDGAMAIFPNGTSALRAAKSIQRGISTFNQQHGGSLLLRCGVSEGPVAWKPGTPIGAIQSPVLDRAALRQRSATPGGIAVGEELVTEAAVEFGRIESAVDAHGERIFVGTP